MACGKKKLSPASWRIFLSSRLLLLYFIIIIFVICTSYEYIINVSVGSTKYAAFVGVGMIAQLREDKIRSGDKNLAVDMIHTGGNSHRKAISKSQAMNNLKEENNFQVEGKSGDKDITQGKNKAKTDNELVQIPANILEQDIKAKDNPENSFNLTKYNEVDSNSGKKLKSIVAIEDSEKNLLTDETIKREAFIETLEHINNETLEKCPEIPKHLQGKLLIKKEVVAMARIVSENPHVLAGGEHTPANCSTRHNVAIIVPYRDRAAQLAVFLRHIHPFLQRQDLHYRVYIINQVDQNLFNRAMLMNVGFAEAMKDFSWDCCIFHDVDLLPEDDRNLYTCPTQPRHMSVAVDKFKYKLPYKTIFGGVAALSVAHFRKLNGFSNQFWGWGGEDDDMSKRIHYHKLRISRYKPEIARYTMIKHKQEKVNKERARVLRSSHTRYKIDGLNSLEYKVVERELPPLYTFLSVELTKHDKAHNIKIKKEKIKELMIKHQEQHHQLHQYQHQHQHHLNPPLHPDIYHPHIGK